MRTELNEISGKLRIADSRRVGKKMRSPGRTAPISELEPHAVDAAFADEAMLMLKERAARRDQSHVASDDAPAPDDALLRSLSAQLDLLHQQQREIRLLLDQAGRRRVDRVSN